MIQIFTGLRSQPTSSPEPRATVGQPGQSPGGNPRSPRGAVPRDMWCGHVWHQIFFTQTPRGNHKTLIQHDLNMMQSCIHSWHSLLSSQSALDDPTNVFILWSFFMFFNAFFDTFESLQMVSEWHKTEAYGISSNIRNLISVVPPTSLCPSQQLPSSQPVMADGTGGMGRMSLGSTILKWTETWV